jgi:hypothetical protein
MILNLEIKNLIADNLKNFTIDETFSHRAVGDKIESLCSKIVESQFKERFSPAKSKRSIEDFIIPFEKKYVFYDVKTHHVQEKAGFSMPNLISVKRLKKFFQNKSQSLNYIFVDYRRNKDLVEILDVKVFNICELDWNNLTIGALGYGQLQIKDKNKKFLLTSECQEKWESQLNKRVDSFYKKQICKFEKQIDIWSS